MNYTEAYRKFNNVQTLFHATKEERQLANCLKQASPMRTGVTLIVTPTKDQSKKLFIYMVKEFDRLNHSISKNSESLRITFKDKIIIFQEITTIRKLAGLKFKEVIFIDY